MTKACSRREEEIARAACRIHNLGVAAQRVSEQAHDPGRESRTGEEHSMPSTIS